MKLLLVTCLFRYSLGLCSDDQYGNLTWPAAQSGHVISLQCDSSADHDNYIRRHCVGREWVTEHDPCRVQQRVASGKRKLFSQVYSIYS